MMNTHRRLLRGSVAALVALATLLALGSFGALGGALAQEASADPRTVSLKASDLRPGFTLNPDPEKTSYGERPGGIVVYEADFTRDRTPQNLNSGPIEIKSLVARTANAQQAADQFSRSRQALLDSGWVESPVAKLGEESAGLAMKGSSSDGPAVAHLFLFRKGAMVVGITVAGLDKPTRMAEAEALASVVLRRIDPTVAAQRATSVPRVLSSPPPGVNTGLARPASPSPAPSPASASPSPSSPTTARPSGGRVQVANTDGQGLNLRVQPSTSATIAAVLPEGTILEVVGPDRQNEGRTWKNVRAAGDGSAWVAGEYVVPVSTPSPPSSSSAPPGSTRSASAPALATPTPAQRGASAVSNTTPTSGLKVDVVPRFAEVAGGPQVVDVWVSRAGQPVENAQVKIETAPQTSSDPLAAPPTDVNGTTSISWTPDASPGLIGIGVIVTASDGASGAGSGSFRIR